MPARNDLASYGDYYIPAGGGCYVRRPSRPRAEPINRRPARVATGRPPAAEAPPPGVPAQHGLVDGRDITLYILFVQGGQVFMVALAAACLCHVWTADPAHLARTLNKLDQLGRLPQGAALLEAVRPPAPRRRSCSTATRSLPDRRRQPPADDPRGAAAQYAQECALGLPQVVARFTLQVRKAPSWPRSWADFSLSWLYSHRNAWASLRLLGHPDAFHAASAGCARRRSPPRATPPRAWRWSR